MYVFNVEFSFDFDELTVNRDGEICLLRICVCDANRASIVIQIYLFSFVCCIFFSNSFN